MNIEKEILRNEIPPTPTRDGVERYQRALARQLFAQFPAATRLIVCRRGPGMSRAPTPLPTEIVYVLASGGRYGRSSSMRLGGALASATPVHPHAMRVAAARRQERQAAHRERRPARWIRADEVA